MILFFLFGLQPRSEITERPSQKEALKMYHLSGGFPTTIPFILIFEVGSRQYWALETLEILGAMLNI